MTDNHRHSHADSNVITRSVRAFWLLGLLNNAPWVLMLACATNISSGGVALVFLANQMPGLAVKISAPYWFHNVTYKSRIKMASLAMGAACFLVGLGGLIRDESASSADANADTNYVDNRDENTGYNRIAEENNNNKGQGWVGLALELFGVCFISFQCSLGEASLLALAGKYDSVVLADEDSLESYLVVSKEQTSSEERNFERHDNGETFQQEYQQDEATNEKNSKPMSLMKKTNNKQKRRCITAFSSGTGLAGIVGYGYKAFFAEVLNWGLSFIVWSAMLFALAYWGIYIRGLFKLEQNQSYTNLNDDESRHKKNLKRDTSGSPLIFNGENAGKKSLVSIENGSAVEQYGLRRTSNGDEEYDASVEMVGHQFDNNQQSNEGNESEMQNQQYLTRQAESSVSVEEMTSFERFKTVLSLWPYTIPLFTVYLAEYMLQAGVWSAIGFPVTSASARAQFYQYSNWTYQAGVFISRSSGNVFTASLKLIWLMPLLQLINLFVFWSISIHHYWYNYSLLLPCFFAGLLGGGVYVQGYSRINTDLPVEMREFAISSASVADGFGILLADIISLFIQSCIYQMNGVEGAVVSCPVNSK